MDLDAIHDLPNWQPIDPDRFAAAVQAIRATDAWVIDGNYRQVVVNVTRWPRPSTRTFRFLEETLGILRDPDLVVSID